MKTVLVFTEKSLALSETFIRDHCESLRAYRPVFVALERVSRAFEPGYEERFVFGDGAASKARKLLFRLGASREVDAAIRAIRPDVIHAHYLTNGAFMLPYARRSRVPLVVTVHGYDATRRLSRRRPYDLIFAARRKAIGRHAAAILPVSDYLKGRIAAHGLAGPNVETHYLGIPIDPRPIADVAANPPRIVFAGRLVEKKGVLAVVEAFGLMRARVPGAELHIVGDGPLRAAVAAAAARVGGVVLHGAQPHARLIEIMRGGRIFTMPSREASDGDAEGLGLTLLEAQAAGLPVVTSRETGTRETCEDGRTGLLVDPRDTGALAEAFALLLTDTARAGAMGAAARDRIGRRFDIATQTDRLEAIYERVVAAG